MSSLTKLINWCEVKRLLIRTLGLGKPVWNLILFNARHRVVDWVLIYLLQKFPNMPYNFNSLYSILNWHINKETHFFRSYYSPTCSISLMLFLYRIWMFIAVFKGGWHHIQPWAILTKLTQCKFVPLTYVYYNNGQGLCSLWGKNLTFL